MIKNKRKRFTFTNGEKVLYCVAILCLCATFVLKIFTSVSSSNLKLELEKINYKIENQENVNESLMTQVSELTSYEKMNKVLKDKGLIYNNENIIVVNK